MAVNSPGAAIQTLWGSRGNSLQAVSRHWPFETPQQQFICNQQFGRFCNDHGGLTSSTFQSTTRPRAQVLYYVYYIYFNTQQELVLAFPPLPGAKCTGALRSLTKACTTKVNLGLLVLNCVYSLSSLDIDPVVVEVRLYTHDSAASVYLNINTTISDTGLSLSFRVIGAVGYI